MVFILMAFKIVASLFSISNHSLVSFSAISFPTLLVWATDLSSTELFAFKSALWVIICGLFLLVWIVTPWLTISSKRGVAIVGLSAAMGLNLFDVISCILSALPILEKALSLSFSALVILLSLRALQKI